MATFIRCNKLIMLTCHSCMKRCLQAIIGRSRQYPIHRQFSTANALRYAPKSTSRDDQRDSPKRKTDVTEDRWSINNQPAIRKNTLPPSRFDRNREKWLQSGKAGPIKKAKNLANDEAAMQKHMMYLKDPMKLSEYIKRTLRADQFATAEAVVRYASKSMPCVVSWNHLIDWQMSKGKMSAAIKTFNEMKKRAQIPDAYTYTIIFRGCAEHKDSKQALEKVLTIYHSMSRDNCPVKPNTIHVNAVLKMCAKAQNLDAMFAIVDNLPETGLDAPNNLTYTTMLNALRTNVISGLHIDVTSVLLRQQAQQAIATGRHIWTDVVKRWRKGDIWIDEELVCAMGRLLLIGSEKDADDILSLIEQTMEIPRHAPPKPQVEPPMFDEKLSKSPQVVTESKDSTVSFIDSSNSNLEDTTQAPIPSDPSPDEEIIPFTETIQPPEAPKGTPAFPRPGRNALSLVLTAVLKLRSHTSSKHYWNLLTSPPHSIIPDAENHLAYLRTLRLTRSSTDSINLLINMRQDQLSHSAFKIAISTCLRDKNNPNAFNNAGKLLDIMLTTQTTPDPSILETYLDIAITAPVHIAPTTNADEEIQRMKFAHGSQISRALQRLQPSLRTLRAVINFTSEDAQRLKEPEREKKISNVMHLVQRMISAYDIIIGKGMVPRDDFKELSSERAQLAAFITRQKHRRGVQAAEREREDDSKAFLEQKRFETMRRTTDYKRYGGKQDKAVDQAET